MMSDSRLSDERIEHIIVDVLRQYREKHGDQAIREFFEELNFLADDNEAAGQYAAQNPDYERWLKIFRTRPGLFQWVDGW